jgi:outer membrane biosynthesis protein TonB
MSPGAAVRIHYALALLRRHGISWHAALHSVAPQSVATQESGFSPPVPVSLVATPYPSQALLGGEVVLDALIDTEGTIAELNVVHGAAPFLKPVLDAVHTWTFLPAQMDGEKVKARIGIVVQFPQSFLPKHTAPDRKYAPPSEDLVDHGPLPVYTVEPDYPLKTVVEGSVVLYQLVDQQGLVTSTHVFHDVEPLTASTLVASQKWEFIPAKEAGSSTSSVVIVVVTFRHP